MINSAKSGNALSIWQCRPGFRWRSTRAKALRFLSSVIRQGREHRPPDDTTGAQIVERGLGLAERALGDWNSRGVAGAGQRHEFFRLRKRAGEYALDGHGAQYKHGDRRRPATADEAGDHHLAAFGEHA